MTSTPPRSSLLRDKWFVSLLVVVSIAFAWILLPFYGAIFWAAVLAILFVPLFEWLLKRISPRRTLAALVATALIVLLVVLPAAFIAGLLVQEALGVYGRITSGELDFGRRLQEIAGALPEGVVRTLQSVGLADFASLQERLSSGLLRGLQFLGARAVSVGQNTLDMVVTFFVMVYVLFFLLRDGRALMRTIGEALPLDARLQRVLFGKFADMIRATIKGTAVVAVVQGALGGLILALLGIQAAVFWGVVMALLSLLPVVGTALVWMPVALYFLVSGSVWSGIVLLAYGVLVIGLVDNVLRPILVGKETKIPDYVILVSTLGGIALLGINGVVIGPAIAALFIAVWNAIRLSRRAEDVDDSAARPD